MMISRPPNLQGGGAGGAVPAAPAQQSGGSPFQVQLQTPQMPQLNVPQPQLYVPGVGSVQGPRIPQIPQPSMQQPTMPGGAAAPQAASGNWLERVIIFLLGMLVGVGLMLLLKR